MWGILNYFQYTDVDSKSLFIWNTQVKKNV